MPTGAPARRRFATALCLTAALALGACADDSELSATSTSTTIPSATTNAKGQDEVSGYLKALPGLTYGDAPGTQDFGVAVGALGLETDGFTRRQILRDGVPIATVGVVHLATPAAGAITTLAAAFGFTAGSAAESRTVAGRPVTAYPAPSGAGLGLAWAVDNQTIVLLSGTDAATTTATAEQLINANQ